MLGTILVAEDNELVRESFSHLLRQHGYTVVEASDGQDALDKLIEGSVDTAIVDIMMPSIGGLELREALLNRDPPVPTILVTGQPDLVADLMGDNHEFLGGTLTVLPKPVHPVKLLAEVEKCVAGKQSE